MMPGVVMMENGVRASLPTNHDREHGQLVNGNGSLAANSSGTLVGFGPGAGSNNGVNKMANGDETGDGANSAQPQRPDPNSSRMNDLPDEIRHITQGFIPLGVLLSRLAQKTHNQLVDEIAALAKMPAPAPTVNGNSAHLSAAIDDTSVENLNKKSRLLNFVQERHAEWVKAAVIARWSRNAQNVSKLIDLMDLFRTQQQKYYNTTDLLAATRISLAHARLPNPDLRTALHVLSTGTAPWMPDFNYIDVPPLTPKEKLQWVENLNTLLSIRLNLEDYDSIPYHFQSYTINSGRVTFKVAGEFEVDLTIADEDFTKQFWFIDFRFDFTPAPAELSEVLRVHLESKVNEVLEKDGLHGCYKFLHELVLTQKITEYVRQAFELSRGRWVDILKVQRLNRAMSIQYWVGRYPADGPKSWIILGVNSGKETTAPGNSGSSSYLTLRWFRDNKEVKDVEIPFDDMDISAEGLLNRVIGSHVEYILRSIHSRLKSNGRFTKREAGIALHIERDDPTKSLLRMQLSHSHYVTVGVSSTTGTFAMQPQSTMTWKGESKLNWSSKDPIQDGLSVLESVRCQYVIEELNRRGKSTGWVVCKGPVKPELVKATLTLREMGQLMWLKRRGWSDPWYLMVSLSLSGDRWFLVELNNSNPSGEAQISSYTKLPLSSYAPNLEDKFFSNLTIFTGAMISHITDLRILHKRRIKHVPHNGTNHSLPANMKVPSVFVRLSDILIQPQYDEAEKRITHWAHDFVEIMYRGIRNSTTRQPMANRDKPTVNGAGESAEPQKESLHAFMDARLKVSDPDRFGLLKGHVERNVAFSKSLGVFALRLEVGVGSTILDTLAQRLQAIDKLADCIDAIRRSDRDIQCEEITLNKVVVTYTDRQKLEGAAAAQPRGHRWKATLELGRDRIQLKFERGNPQLRSLDHLQYLVNSDLRCEKLPYYLSSTLPIHRALDSVEDAWSDLEMNNQGRVHVISPHLDWFNIHYYLPGPNRSMHTPRRLNLQLRLENRREDAAWEITRVEAGSKEKSEDEFKQVLEKVYNAEGRVWRSLGDSAAITTDHRVGDLIRAVDEAVRRLAMQSPPTAVRPSQPKGQGQVKNQAQAVYHKTMAASRARPQTGQVVVLDD
ncbi:MED14-domain-containing protein [Jackrogersella minutella]|nr:MED14-domain-containing protein [Jackrogersella minutella]